MTDIDLAWAAGLFEGEGSLGLTAIKNRANSIKVSAVICMTDKDIIERFTAVMGFGVMKGPYKSSYPTGKLRYTWEVQSQPDVLRVIEMFLPFFGERRKEKALSMKREIMSRAYAKNGFPKGFDGNIYSQNYLTKD